MENPRIDYLNVQNLTLENMLTVYFKEENFENKEVIVFDFGFMNRVEPLAMLLFSSRLRQLRIKFPETRFRALNHEHNTYASHMGFFESFGLSHGKKPGEASGSSTYLPITMIDVKQLRIESYESDNGIVQQVIWRKAIEMAEILCFGNEEIKHAVFRCLNEILRNTVEHSETERVWICAQCWTYKREIEIAILDEGVGINQTLKVNPYLTIPNEHTALTLALQPSISGKAFIHNGVERGHLDGGWDHSGFGLYIASEISRRNGSFLVCSGDSAIFLNSEGSYSYELHHSGTAVRLRVNIDQLETLTRSDIDKIINEGEFHAATSYSDFALTKASSASKKSFN